MREIKFRAWDKQEEMMRSFDNLCDGDYDTWPSLYYALIGHETYIPMQYTGLKDKNGKEIYEGDILQKENTHRMVLFNNGCFHLSWHTADENDQIDLWEVIGNIYDNPELIKY